MSIGGKTHLMQPLPEMEKVDSCNMNEEEEFVDIVHKPPETAQTRASIKDGEEFKQPQELFEEEMQCSVCLFEKMDVVLPCMHAFCSECIKEWLTKEMSCPLCR